VVFSAAGHLLHLARVGFVLAREGVFGLIPADRVPPLARPALWLARVIARRKAANRAERLMAALTRLGPSYVKTGQFLSTRPDIVGVSIAQDLSLLQDTMPAFAQAEAERVVAAALGRPIEEAFASFGPAVAAASIAQVHRAEINEDGARRAVAIKVLRPGVARIFQKDIEAQAFAARLIERLVPASRRLRIVDVIHTLERTVQLEMDLRFEAAALSEMAENTAGDPGFRVPSVEWNLTSREVLALEWIDGIKLSDLTGLDAAGIDRKALARTAMESFLRHALRDGFFHADMHQGNLFALRDGTLVAVDLGIMGRLGAKERRFLAEILFGFITRNYRRIAEVHFEAGYVPAHHRVEDFAQALRTIGEKIHGRHAAEISMADLLGLLFEITGLFDMATRTELVLLQKTMVVVEGVSRSLDPEFNMWRTAEPVLRDWIERNLGPFGRIEEAGRDALALFRSAQQVPDLVTRGQHVLAQLEADIAGREKMNPPTVGHSSITIALWIIALAMVALAIRAFSP
jgi:ubiquinone biosynthesis protein